MYREMSDFIRFINWPPPVIETRSAELEHSSFFLGRSFYIVTVVRALIRSIYMHKTGAVCDEVSTVARHKIANQTGLFLF